MTGLMVGSLRPRVSAEQTGENCFSFYYRFKHHLNQLFFKKGNSEKRRAFILESYWNGAEGKSDDQHCSFLCCCTHLCLCVWPSRGVHLLRWEEYQGPSHFFNVSLLKYFHGIFIHLCSVSYTVHVIFWENHLIGKSLCKQDRETRKMYFSAATQMYYMMDNSFNKYINILLWW